MKRVLGLVTFFLSIGFCLHAQTLRPEQARADVDYLKKKMDRLHPGIGQYIPEKTYNQLFDSLHLQLLRPIAYQAFFQTATPLITSLKDGHTALLHRKKYYNKNRRLIPFYIRNVGPTYYISHNLSSDSTLVRGTELLSINQQPVAALHQLLQDVDRSGSDGDNQSGRRSRSLIAFSSYYYNWFGPSDSVQVAFRLPNDTLIQTRFVRCENRKVIDANLTKRYKKELNQTPNLSVRVVDSLAHTAVLRVSTFGGNLSDFLTGKFPRKLKRAFREIERKEITNLVVDVRSNGGGAVKNSARLLQYWIPQPFRLLERETMKRGFRSAFVTWYNPVTWVLFPVFYKKDPSGGYTERFAGRPHQPKTRYAYRGQLYFLVNGASYSATATVLAQTLTNQLGTFVGEATGGAYWGDFAGQFKMITLPHSGLRVRIPLKRMAHAVDPRRANGFTVEPDFPVERTYDDLLHGRDFGMQYTLQLIKDGKVADRGHASKSLSEN
ncbi:S41 family peptidase [Larkinella sp. C7]|jgi:hypothetical protein|uniref:S41 family peptidase n=1 Tax=Larkinella sp. C7 TaxID=2576607 RepID=UPI00111159C9|nr:S41 family peptidase [Larkinella sp. C7]